MTLIATFVTLILAVSLPESASLDQRSAERAYALRGDAIVWRGRPHRLAGIVTPDGQGVCDGVAAPREYGCNGEARRFLDDLLSRGAVQCVRVRGISGYRCEVAGLDIASELVLSGNAGAIGPRGTSYDYSVEMLYAQQLSRGVWRLGPAIRIDPSRPLFRVFPPRNRADRVEPRRD